MKKAISLAVVVMFLLAAIAYAEFNQDFTKNFVGTVGDKYKIQMKLVSSKNMGITGSCLSEITKEESKLMGTSDPEGNLVIIEYDGLRNIIGVFVGKFKSENKIVGVWSNPDGSKQMSFVLEETATDFSGWWEGINDQEGDSSSKFVLTLKQENNKIYGYHDNIAYNPKNDSYMQESVSELEEAPSIEGTVSGNVAIITIKSPYNDTPGKAKITYNGDNTITWEITEKPNGDFYLPSKMKLLRVK